MANSHLGSAGAEWVEYSAGARRGSFTLGEVSAAEVVDEHYDNARILLDAQPTDRRRLASFVHIAQTAIHIDMESGMDGWTFYASRLPKRRISLTRLAGVTQQILETDPALQPAVKGIEVLDEEMRERVHINQLRLLEDFEEHVIHDDPDVLAINKPSHVSSMWDDFYHIGANEIAQEWRGDVAAVHRLDRLTSGVLLFGKSSEAREHLSRQIRREDEENGNNLKKMYVAIVEGELEDDQSVRLFLRRKAATSRMVTSIDPQSGKLAKTTARNLLTFETRAGKRCSVLGVEIHTGRTHQIRASLAAIGLPILHDPLYGQRSTHHRLRLHANSLTFTPLDSGEEIEVRAPLPNDFFSDVNNHTREQIETAASTL